MDSFFKLPDVQMLRAAINKANAQHSTGPRTETGKERVRFNALKHGACSRYVVLPGEDAELFQSLGAKLTAVYEPETPEQRELIVALQEIEWRLARITTTEQNLFAYALREHLEQFEDEEPAVAHGLAQAAAFVTYAREFAQLSRHEARLLRSRAAIMTEIDAFLIARVDRQRARASERAPKPTTQTAEQKHAAATPGFVLKSPAARAETFAVGDRTVQAPGLG